MDPVALSVLELTAYADADADWTDAAGQLPREKNGAENAAAAAIAIADAAAVAAAAGVAIPAVDPLVERARALVVPEMEDLSWAVYNGQRMEMGLGKKEVDEALDDQIEWYKAAQMHHTKAQEEYLAFLEETMGSRPPMGNRPPYQWSEHHVWLAQEIKAYKGQHQLPDWRTEWLTQLAEIAAAWALEQAERRVWILMHPLWGMGYYTLASRRRHEGYARSSANDCLE
ncbi:hypothetical protein BKA56DRAFT_619321 [Ilyonectria sp. MPI-CAGE-AT-0026]|nr:hypothetical protein BKA56DRAFT_619321 [Ilyonectria sp. MPI-CAGE-AT-0026]